MDKYLLRLNFVCLDSPQAHIDTDILVNKYNLLNIMTMVLNRLNSNLNHLHFKYMKVKQVQSI